MGLTKSVGQPKPFNGIFMKVSQRKSRFLQELVDLCIKHRVTFSLIRPEENTLGNTILQTILDGIYLKEIPDESGEGFTISIDDLDTEIKNRIWDIYSVKL